ncbi:5-dehydro-4-deoxyglucarate dehydratase [Labrys okinawensis]|uniref:5-dehydro-4-deoxyglucarate dehydratase n=1 Tax=Labrys okinawensis TaxID=346911 RepID=UPI0039BD0830
MGCNQISEGLAARLQGGVLSFPITDYTANGHVDLDGYAQRLAWLSGFDPAAIFPCAGAGEFFSLDGQELDALLRTAIESRPTGIPVVASVGYNLTLAIEMARRAEAGGADGLLVMPPYLTRATQEGLFHFVRAVCDSVGLPVLVYNRGTCDLAPDTVKRLAEACRNLVGIKDGHGNIEVLVALRSTLGDRLLFVNGMPTAEMFAYAYAGLGIPTYSSGVFNFVPGIATAFRRALSEGDRAVSDRILRDFFLPYTAIRGNTPGYAVTILRAGARIVGRGAGPTRPPLADITPAEYAALEALTESTAGLAA